MTVVPMLSSPVTCRYRHLLRIGQPYQMFPQIQKGPKGLSKRNVP